MAGVPVHRPRERAPSIARAHGTMNKQRDFSIDFLRCVGAFVVMAAHVGAPAWFFQLRNFGTPMLVVVSALSAAVVFRHRRLDPWLFLKRRLLKLTLPAWTFLTFFFMVVLAYSAVLGKPFPFSRDDLVDSYALRSGIGYVWIFRIYIVIALLTPPLLWARARMPDRRTGMLVLAGAYAVFEGLAALVRMQTH